MRIASFNLENLDLSAAADPPLAERLPILRPQIERLDADILCLQEVNAQADTNKPHGERRLAALDALLEGTSYAGFHRAATATHGRPTPMDVHNLVILSRRPIGESRQFWNDLVPAPRTRMVTAEPDTGAPADIGWDRPLLYARIDAADGPPLHVFNLHLRAPLAAAIPGQKEAPFVWRSVAGWAEGYYLSAIKRTGQALEARLAVEALFDADPDARVMVCGDMNAGTHEMPLRILCADPEETGNGRLAARSLVALDDRVSGAQRHSVIHGGRRLLPDHLLASRSLAVRCTGVEIHNETLGDELVGYAAVHHSPESYHAPLVATFSD
ncbi:MAG: endonuclease/exonuclease/phosphatase family protein [Rhodospirillaceae bacterium]